MGTVSFLAIKNTGKFQIPWTFPNYSLSESRAGREWPLAAKGLYQALGSLPPAASGAPPFYLLWNQPFSVALALRVRPRARRACAACAPSSCWFYVINTTGLQWPTGSQDLHSKSKAHPSRLSMSHAWGALPCKERRRCFSMCFPLALCNQNSTNASVQALGQKGWASKLRKDVSQ